MQRQTSPPWPFCQNTYSIIVYDDGFHVLWCCAVQEEEEEVMDCRSQCSGLLGTQSDATWHSPSKRVCVFTYVLCIDAFHLLYLHHGVDQLHLFDAINKYGMVSVHYITLKVLIPYSMINYQLWRLRPHHHEGRTCLLWRWVHSHRLAFALYYSLHTVCRYYMYKPLLVINRLGIFPPSIL